MIEVMNDLKENQLAYDSLSLKFPSIIRLQDKFSDKLKSLDYYNALHLIDMYGNEDSHILNLGCSNDASLWYLSELGYKHLYGMDKNHNVIESPFGWRIKYLYGDMLNTHFPVNMFDFILSISVIEHGNGVPQFKKFLEESKRIMKDKGILFMTMDYSEKPIDTGKYASYGVGWHIFNKQEIKELIEYAEVLGFNLLENVPIPDNHNLPIRSGAINKSYTFLTLVLRLNKAEKVNDIKEINIVCSSLGKKCGINKYTNSLAIRFGEIGIKANLFKNENEIHRSNKFPTIHQFETSLETQLPEDKNAIIELHTYSTKNDTKRRIRNIFRLGSPFWSHPIKSTMSFLKTEHKVSKLDKYQLLVFNNELVEEKFANYTLMPHIKYPEINYIKKEKKGLCIGAFGFALKFKNFDKICELAKRLNINAVIVLSYPDINGEMELEGKSEIKRLRDKYQSDKINIVESFDDAKTLSELSVCTHIVFAQNDVFNSSGSMRFPMQLGVPIISTDVYQAKETQLQRVKSLDDISINYLNKTTETTRLDDGFYYLCNFLGIKT